MSNFTKVFYPIAQKIFHKEPQAERKLRIWGGRQFNLAFFCAHFIVVVKCNYCVYLLKKILRNIPYNS